MDTNFMETCWYIFSQLYNKGLVYKAFKVMPYSYKLETSLSNFEAGENYKSIKTKSVYVAFELKNTPNVFIVAWTTTHFSLPSNLALCVNPDMRYVLCRDENNKSYIVGENSVNNLNKKFVSVEFYAVGKDMKYLEYKPLFNYINYSYHKVLVDDYVKDSPINGTGIVHLAPSLGEDDCRVCVDAGVISPKNLDQVCPIDSTCRYTSIMKDLAGILVFDATEILINKLKQNGSLLRIQQIEHDYPHCPRSHTPLMYRALPSWFIDVPKIKSRMMELNKEIYWSQQNIGSGRFHNWLAQARPWAVSRNRFFGTPLPIWKSNDDTEIVIISSIDELMEYEWVLYNKEDKKERPKDLHIDFISKIQLYSKTTNNILKLDMSVFDCWFESGCVPYGQLHWPFENKDFFNNRTYLADFCDESLDQVRGWFYTLLVISTAISDKPPFKNVICNGIILDNQGNKFSKSAGNAPNSLDLLKTYGADIIRLYLVGSPVVKAEPLFFNTKFLSNMKQQIIPYYNSVKFFLENYITVQKNGENLKILYLDEQNVETLNNITIMDKWILEKVCILKKEVEFHMDKYHPDTAIKNIIDFVEDLTNWYVKFNRSRIKGIFGKDELITSMSTLFTVLIDYMLITAPFTPFFSEMAYMYMKPLLPQNMQTFSIHALKYPNHNMYYNMTQSFSRLQKVSRLIRQLRESSEKHTSFNIPIKSCVIYHHNQEYLNDIKQLIDLIQDGLNCLDFQYKLISDDLINYTTKVNMKSIGQKFKKDGKEVKLLIESLSQSVLKNFYDKIINQIDITLCNGQSISVTTNDFEVLITKNLELSQNMKYAEGESLLLCCDLTYDVEIHTYGQIRKFCSLIQNMRKTMGLKKWNTILINYSFYPENNEFSNAIIQYQQFILKKLGTNIKYVNSIIASSNSKEFLYENYDNTKTTIIVEVVLLN
jgi:isoleucyl-tRNA synthetase